MNLQEWPDGTPLFESEASPALAQQLSSAAQRFLRAPARGGLTRTGSARQRGAGRPGGRRVTRSSAASGDSGDDGPGEPTAEEVVLALRSHGCEVEPRGRSTWRARCPVCSAADALSVRAGGLHDLVGVWCGRCGREAVLAVLGLGGDR